MQNKSDKNYFEILLEEMRDKFNTVLELTRAIQEQLENKSDKSDISRLENKFNVIEYSISQQSKQTSTLSARVKRLEAHSSR